MSKFQKGDRVVKSTITGLITHVDSDTLHVVLDSGRVLFATPEQLTHVTESLDELPPVMGERLTYNGLDVVYLADSKSGNPRHWLSDADGKVRVANLAQLSRPKRTKTVSRRVFYNEELRSYVTRSDDPMKHDTGWVKVAEFTHEVDV